MSKKSPVKQFTDMAVGTALFGAGASIIGDTQASIKDPAMKSIVGAAGTVYAAKYLNDMAGGIGCSKKKKGDWGL